MKTDLIKLFGILVAILMLALAGCASSSDDGDGDASGDTSADTSSVGTAANPVKLTYGTAENVSVGVGSGLYYSFTTTGSGSYALSLASLSSNVAVSMISETSYVTAVSTGDIGSCSTDCSLNLSNLDATTDYYFFASAEDGTTFTITLTDGIGQGSENDPEPLTLGTALNGELEGNYNYSYYDFTSTTAGGYLIQFNDLDPALYIALWDKSEIGSDINTAVKETLHFGTDCHGSTAVEKYCIYTLEGSTEYLVRISAAGEDTADDVEFNITASRGAGAGTGTSPVALTMDTTTDTTLYTSIQNFKSYYSFTDTTTDYTFDFAGSTNWFSAKVFDSTNTEVTTSCNPQIATASCTLHGDGSGNTSTLELSNSRSAGVNDSINSFSFRFRTGL